MLDEIKNSIEELHSLFKKLNQRITDNFEHSTKGIELCFERLEKLEEINKAETKLAKNIIFEGERIKKLEDMMNDSLSPSAYAILLKRIEILEHLFSGKVKNPIYDAIETHIEGFNLRIQSLESDSRGIALDPKVWDFLTKRIDKLENKVIDLFDLEELVAALENIQAESRLIALESQSFGITLDPKVWDFLTKRVDELETGLNLVKALGSRAYHPKKPHKCPVCGGCGNDKGETIQNTNYEFAMKYAACHACEGKGIIWG